MVRNQQLTLSQTSPGFSLNIFILHRLRNKFQKLILMSLDSASWELHQYSRRMCGPMKKIPKLTPAPGNRTWDLKITRPTLYLTTTDTTRPSLRVCSTSLLKTLWEKEKLLVTRNFSFSHSVFYPFGELSAVFIKFEIVVCKLFLFERVSTLSFGKGLRDIAAK